MVTLRARLVVVGCAWGLFTIVVACGRTLSGDPPPSTPMDAAGTGEDDAVASVEVTDGAADAADASIDCPDAMVRATSFCIDAREVTVEEYLAMLVDTDGGALVVDAGARCAWKSALTQVPAPDASDLPVLGVDWCDAMMYCLGSGKRLCGSVDGTVQLSKNPAAGQWFIACSQSAARAYPYGNVFERERCNLKPNKIGSATRDSGCSGGYDGLMDMSGNAREWEDNCAETGKQSDRSCLTRGGSILHDKAGDVSCSATVENARKDAPPDVGFRCCWP